MKKKTIYAPFLQMKYDGLDSIIAGMTLDEKIGQVLFIHQPMYFDEKTDSTKQHDFHQKITQYHLGGVFLDNVYETKSIDSIHSNTKIPLLKGYNGINNTYNPASLSDATTLLSIRDENFIKDRIENKANFYQNLGIEILFDANVNAITRQDSSLQDSLFILQQSKMLKINEQIINSCQREGIAIGAYDCSDFHSTQANLFPYRQLTYSGLSAMLMDSSIYNSELLKEEPTGSVAQFLSDSLDFRGLSFIYVDNDHSLLTRLKSGISIFITNQHKIEQIFETYKKAIQEGTIPIQQLDQNIKKVLLAKKWSEQTLTRGEYSSDENIEAQQLKINDEEALLAEQTISVVKDANNIIPTQKVTDKKFLVLSNYPNSMLFDEYEIEIEEHQLTQSFNLSQLRLTDLQKYDCIFIAINEGILELSKDSLKNVRQQLAPFQNLQKVVFIFQGEPTSLVYFQDFASIIYIPSKKIYHAQLASQVIFGGMKALGQFPMNISDKIKYGQGTIQNKVFRLRHHGIFNTSDERLNQIDSIINEGIKNKAMPSCQVMVVKDGRIYYEKAFGHQTYDKKKPVLVNHLYDLASITKVLSTTLAMMRLYDEGKYQLSDSLHQILELEEDATIRDITIKELLIHQTGLQANMPIIPFLRNRSLYQKKRQENATIHVAENFYMYDEYLDTLWHEIQTLEIGEKVYKYSDVNANILQRVVEKLAEASLDVYVGNHFYEPLLMRRTTYLPLEKFKEDEIVPTEKDKNWRKQLVHGYVHDESAAILGGVAGNAGLFSTVQDIAIVSQMLLFGGTYAGKRYLKEETVQLFTASTHGNHRGLGFNKQRETGTAACAAQAPLSTYGHTGFTGNCFWVDPENNLIYIFLSNRVYPKRNPRLSKQKIRERIHEVIYESMTE